MQCTMSRTLFDLWNRLEAAERTPHEYGAGDRLYRGEIDLLDFIHYHPHANMNALASAMGVTRSAITQIGGRLEAKGLVEKYANAKNKKEKYYRLTEKGAHVRAHHAALHEKANKNICAFMQSLDEAEAAAVMQFIAVLQENLPLSLCDCHHEAATPCCTAASGETSS